MSDRLVAPDEPPAFTEARSNARPGLTIGNNKPYFVSDETGHTIPQHGERRGLRHVEIEIRRDLIFGAAGQDEWARRITRALQAAGGSFSGGRP